MVYNCGYEAILAVLLKSIIFDRVVLPLQRIGIFVPLVTQKTKRSLTSYDYKRIERLIIKFSIKKTVYLKYPSP